MSRKPNPETAVVAEVLEAVRSLPSVRRAWRQQSGAVRTRNGWMHLAPIGTPDVGGFLDTGIALQIEVKLPGESLSKEQAEFLTEARSCGACAFVAVSGAQAIRLVLAFTQGEPLPEVQSVIELAKSRKKKPAPFVRPARQEALL